MDKELIEKVAIIIRTYDLPKDCDRNSSGIMRRTTAENCARHILAEAIPIIAKHERDRIRKNFRKDWGFLFMTEGCWQALEEGREWI